MNGYVAIAHSSPSQMGGPLSEVDCADARGRLDRSRSGLIVA
jgi:hypothetical protein